MRIKLGEDELRINLLENRDLEILKFIIDHHGKNIEYEIEKDDNSDIVNQFILYKKHDYENNCDVIKHLTDILLYICMRKDFTPSTLHILCNLISRSLSSNDNRVCLYTDEDDDHSIHMSSSTFCNSFKQLEGNNILRRLTSSKYRKYIEFKPFDEWKKEEIDQ